MTPHHTMHRLYDSSVRLMLDRSLDTDLPGTNFSPLVEVRDSSNDELLKVRAWCVKWGGVGRGRD